MLDTQIASSSTATPEAPCYRELYYDEQIARAERLASAGTRLKERIASIKQSKEERRVQLDTRLRAPEKRSRRTAAWTRQAYRPKSIMDKAKERAGRVAFAYEPPRFTKRSMLRPSTIAPSPEKRPAYKEVDERELEREKRRQAEKAREALFTRRGAGAGELAKSPIKEMSYKAAGLQVPKEQPKPVEVDSVTPRPSKMSSEQSSRASSSGVAAKKLTTSSPRPQPSTVTSATPLPLPPPPSAPVRLEPRPIRNIPGITRRPKPSTSAAGSGSEPESALSPPALSPPATSSSSTALSPASSQAGSPPPAYFSPDAQLSPRMSGISSASYGLGPTNKIVQEAFDLPMLSKRPTPSVSTSGPSLFITRKRPRTQQ